MVKGTITVNNKSGLHLDRHLSLRKLPGSLLQRLQLLQEIRK